jgi:hypothetical protein
MEPLMPARLAESVMVPGEFISRGYHEFSNDIGVDLKTLFLSQRASVAVGVLDRAIMTNSDKGSTEYILLHARKHLRNLIESAQKFVKDGHVGLQDVISQKK